jgi:drug/metabolite transporter (DMT)-like permease
MVLREQRTILAAGVVAVAAVLWGMWPLVLRPAGLPPLQSALITQVVMGLPAVVLWWRERSAFRDRGAVGALVAYGLVDAAQCALYFPALARGPVAVAALTHYLGPVLVALAAGFIPGERSSRRALLAAPLSLAGLLLVLGPPRQAPLLTAALGAGSAFFGAACLFAVRRATRAFSPLAALSLHGVLAAVFLLAVFGRDAIPAPGMAALRVAGAAVVLGLLAGVLFIRAVQNVRAPTASTITYVEPVTAAAIGSLVLGERLGALAALGTAVVVGAGVWAALEPAAAPVVTIPREESEPA